MAVNVGGSAGARHGGHRGRALGHHRSPARPGHGSLCGDLRGRARARSAQGRIAAAASGSAESVIATDVIAALPDALRAVNRVAGSARACASSTSARSSETAPGCRRAASGAELCAVVKADGYGHGAVECARAALAGGATWLAVAAAAEAAELRAASSRRADPVMGALTEAELERRPRGGLRRRRVAARVPRLVAERGPRLGGRPRVHVKYDTGMGRLGDALPGCGRGAGRAGTPWTIASSWRASGPTSRPPTSRLRTSSTNSSSASRRSPSAVRAEHPGVLVHAANSAATLRDSTSHFDLVRCGIAIYGLDPFHSRPVRSRARARPGAALLRRRRQALSSRFERRLRAPLDCRGGHLGRGAADRLRRRRSSRADQQRRGAGRGSPPPNGGHRVHG